jgi:hypothetical protein
MPTVEINILWDGAACCFQIARIFIYFAALYKWNIQCAATSDVCHDYSAALCVVCQLVISIIYVNTSNGFAVLLWNINLIVPLLYVLHVILLLYSMFLLGLAILGMSISMGQA